MPAGGGGASPKPGATFDVGPIYELGSAWSVMGDALNQHMFQLSGALSGVTWDGPAADEFLLLFNQVLNFLQNLPQAAWQLGAEINAYGDQAAASEKKYEQEQHASFIQAIIEAVLGILGVLTIVAGPILTPLIGADVAAGVAGGLGVLVSPITTVISLLPALDLITADNPFLIAGEIAGGFADAAAQMAWMTAVEDKMLGSPFNFPKPDWSTIVQDAIFSIGGPLVGRAVHDPDPLPEGGLGGLQSGNDSPHLPGTGSLPDPEALPGGIPAVPPPRVDPPPTHGIGDISLPADPPGEAPPRVDPGRPDGLETAAPAATSGPAPEPPRLQGPPPADPHDPGVPAAGPGRPASAAPAGPHEAATPAPEPARQAGAASARPQDAGPPAPGPARAAAGPQRQAATAAGRAEPAPDRAAAGHQGRPDTAADSSGGSPDSGSSVSDASLASGSPSSDAARQPLLGGRPRPEADASHAGSDSSLAGASDTSAGPAAAAHDPRSGVDPQAAPEAAPPRSLAPGSDNPAVAAGRDETRRWILRWREGVWAGEPPESGHDPFPASPADRPAGPDPTPQAAAPHPGDAVSDHGPGLSHDDAVSDASHAPAHSAAGADHADGAGASAGDPGALASHPGASHPDASRAGSSHSDAGHSDAGHSDGPGPADRAPPAGKDSAGQVALKTYQRLAKILQKAGDPRPSWFEEHGSGWVRDTNGVYRSLKSTTLPGHEDIPVPAGSDGIFSNSRLVAVAGPDDIRFTWHDDGSPAGRWIKRGDGDDITLFKVRKVKIGGVSVRDVDLVLDKGQPAPSGTDDFGGILGEKTADVQADLASKGLDQAALTAVVLPRKITLRLGDGTEVKTGTIRPDGAGGWKPADISPIDLQAHIAAANGHFSTATTLTGIGARGLGGRGVGGLSNSDLGLLGLHGSAPERDAAIYQAVQRATNGKQLRWTQVSAWKHIMDGGPWDDLPAATMVDMKTGEGKSLVNAAVVAERALRLAHEGGAAYFGTPRGALLADNLPEITAIAKPLGMRVHLVDAEGKAPVIASGKPTIYAGTIDNHAFSYLRLGRLAGQPEDVALRGRAMLHLDESDEALIYGPQHFNIRLGGDRLAAPHEAELATLGQKLVDHLAAAPDRDSFFSTGPGKAPRLTEAGKEAAKEALATMPAASTEAKAAVKGFLDGHPDGDEVVARIEVSKFASQFRERTDYLAWTTPKGRRIILINKVTGEPMANLKTSTQVRYNDRLGQALEAKHGLDIYGDDSRGMTTSIADLTREFDHVSGVSGTNQGLRAEFAKVLGKPIDLKMQQRFYESQVTARGDVRYTSVGDQLDGAAAAAVKASGDQPVLVIAPNNAHAGPLAQKIRDLGHEDVTMADAGKVLDEGMKPIQDMAATRGEPGKITVVTSIGARGVDYRLTGAGKALGYHVIILDRSDIDAVNVQAQGRTGRSGAPGSFEHHIAPADSPAHAPADHPTTVVMEVDSLGPRATEPSGAAPLAAVVRPGATALSALRPAAGNQGALAPGPVPATAAHPAASTPFAPLTPPGRTAPAGITGPALAGPVRVLPPSRFGAVSAEHLAQPAAGAVVNPAPGAGAVASKTAPVAPAKSLAAEPAVAARGPGDLGAPNHQAGSPGALADAASTHVTSEAGGILATPAPVLSRPGAAVSPEHIQAARIDLRPGDFGPDRLGPAARRGDQRAVAGATAEAPASRTRHTAEGHHPAAEALLADAAPAARGVQDGPARTPALSPSPHARATRPAAPLARSLAELAGLVGEVPAEPDDTPGRIGPCVRQLRSLRDALYPRDGDLADGVRAAAAADDWAAGLHRPEDLLAPGADWARVSGWAEVTAALERAGPGASAFVLWQRRSDDGHAFAAHHTRDRGVAWLDVSRQGDASGGLVRERDLPAAADVRAVIVGPDGQVARRVLERPGQARFAESGSVARALIDPPASRAYGKTGFELELHGIRLEPAQVQAGQADADAGPGADDSDTGSVSTGSVSTGLGFAMERDVPEFLGESPLLKLERDKYQGQWILEVVSKPAAALPGEAGPDPDEVEAAAARLLQAVNGLRPSQPHPIENVLPPEFSREADALGVRLISEPGIPGRHDRHLYVHYTSGFALAALRGVLLWVRDKSGSRLPAEARADFADALRFGDVIATRYLGEDVTTLAERDLDEDVQALRGFATLAYTQVAAELHGILNDVHFQDHGTLWKNFAIVAARTSLAGARRSLPAPVREFLAEQAGGIRNLLRATFSSRHVGPGHSYPDTVDVLAVSAGGTTSGHYLDNALLADPPHVVSQYEALGIRSHFRDMDDGVAGGPGQVVLEMRYVGPVSESFDGFSRTYREISNLAKRSYAAVVQARRDRLEAQASALGSPPEAVTLTFREGKARELAPASREAARTRLGPMAEWVLQVGLIRRALDQRPPAFRITGYSNGGRLLAKAPGVTGQQRASHIRDDLAARILEQLRRTPADLRPGLSTPADFQQFISELLPHDSVTGRPGSERHGGEAGRQAVISIDPSPAAPGPAGLPAERQSPARLPGSRRAGRPAGPDAVAQAAPAAPAIVTAAAAEIAPGAVAGFRPGLLDPALASLAFGDPLDSQQIRQVGQVLAARQDPAAALPDLPVAESARAAWWLLRVRGLIDDPRHGVADDVRDRAGPVISQLLTQLYAGLLAPPAVPAEAAEVPAAAPAVFSPALLGAEVASLPAQPDWKWREITQLGRFLAEHPNEDSLARPLLGLPRPELSRAANWLSRSLLVLADQRAEVPDSVPARGVAVAERLLARVYARLADGTPDAQALRAGLTPASRDIVPYLTPEGRLVDEDIYDVPAVTLAAAAGLATGPDEPAPAPADAPRRPAPGDDTWLADRSARAFPGETPDEATVRRLLLADVHSAWLDNVATLDTSRSRPLAELAEVARLAGSRVAAFLGRFAPGQGSAPVRAAAPIRGNVTVKDLFAQRTAQVAGLSPGARQDLARHVLTEYRGLGHQVGSWLDDREAGPHGSADAILTAAVERLVADDDLVARALGTWARWPAAANPRTQTIAVQLIQSASAEENQRLAWWYLQALVHESIHLWENPAFGTWAATLPLRARTTLLEGVVDAILPHIWASQIRPLLRRHDPELGLVVMGPSLFAERGWPAWQHDPVAGARYNVDDAQRLIALVGLRPVLLAYLGGEIHWITSRATGAPRAALTAPGADSGADSGAATAMAAERSSAAGPGPARLPGKRSEPDDGPLLDRPDDQDTVIRRPRAGGSSRSAAPLRRTGTDAALSGQLQGLSLEEAPVLGHVANARFRELADSEILPDSHDDRSYSRLLRRSARRKWPLSYVVNLVVALEKRVKVREEEFVWVNQLGEISGVIDAIMAGLTEEFTVAFVIGVNMPDSAPEAARLDRAFREDIPGVLAGISHPVAAVKITWRGEPGDDFPFGTVRNDTLYSAPTIQLVNALVRLETHPYISIQDFDRSPRGVPSGAHVFEHVSSRLNDDMESRLPVSRPLLVMGGYRHVPGDPGNSTQKMLALSVREDMIIRDRLARVHPNLPYGPEPNLFIDGTLLLRHGREDLAFGPKGAEWMQLAGSANRINAAELSRYPFGADDLQHAEIDAANVRHPVRGRAFVADFVKGAAQTDLARFSAKFTRADSSKASVPQNHEQVNNLRDGFFANKDVQAGIRPADARNAALRAAPGFLAIPDPAQRPADVSNGVARHTAQRWTPSAPFRDPLAKAGRAPLHPKVSAPLEGRLARAGIQDDEKTIAAYLLAVSRQVSWLNEQFRRVRLVLADTPAPIADGSLYHAVQVALDHDEADGPALRDSAIQAGLTRVTAEFTELLPNKGRPPNSLLSQPMTRWTVEADNEFANGHFVRAMVQELRQPADGPEARQHENAWRFAGRLLATSLNRVIVSTAAGGATERLAPFTGDPGSAVIHLSWSVRDGYRRYASAGPARIQPPRPRGGPGQGRVRPAAEDPRLVRLEQAAALADGELEATADSVRRVSAILGRLGLSPLRPGGPDGLDHLAARLSGAADVTFRAANLWQLDRLPPGRVTVVLGERLAAPHAMIVQRLDAVRFAALETPAAGGQPQVTVFRLRLDATPPVGWAATGEPDLARRLVPRLWPAPLRDAVRNRTLRLPKAPDRGASAGAVAARHLPDDARVYHRPRARSLPPASFDDPMESSSDDASDSADDE